MHEALDELWLKIKARYPYVYLVTWEEQRALRRLKKVARDLKRSLWTWSSLQGLRGPKAKDKVADTQAPGAALSAIAALEGPGLLVLRDFHPHIRDPAIVRQLRGLSGQLAEMGWTILFLGPRAEIPFELEKDIAVLDLPLPGLKEVAKLFHTLLKGEGQELELPLFERFVKATLGLSEEEIKRVYSKVLLRSGRFGEEQLREVINEKAQIIRRSRYLEFHPLSVSMDDVGGLDNLKEWVGTRDNAFTERARTYGLPQPRGLFLLGIQGCGKSLIAKAIADQWKVPLLRLDIAALVLGESRAEEGLSQTFRIAESMAPAVLWLDEIEKAFSGVNQGAAETASAARLFGSFITWLQEKSAPVFVVSTGNDVRNLPPELLRKGRFDEIFWVDLPDIHERQIIFDIHLRRRQRDPAAFDSWELAESTEKFSGSEIEQAVVDGMYRAFAEDREVETRDVLRSVRETVPLARTMDTQIKELKEWARDRTRPATYNTRRIDYFEDWAGANDEEAEA